MPKYNKTAIAAAFSTVARLVRQGEPIVLKHIEGLNSASQGYFAKAITHNFNEKDHGFNLQRIFIVDQKDSHKWHRNTSPNTNPKDDTLIDLIILAMQWVSKNAVQHRLIKEVVPVNPFDAFTLEDLKAEVARREKAIALKTYADKFGISVEELPKLVEAILALLGVKQRKY